MYSECTVRSFTTPTPPHHHHHNHHPPPRIVTHPLSLDDEVQSNIFQNKNALWFLHASLFKKAPQNSDTLSETSNMVKRHHTSILVKASLIEWWSWLKWVLKVFGHYCNNCINKKEAVSIDCFPVLMVCVNMLLVSIPS